MVAPAGATPWPQITSVLPRRASWRMTGTSPPGPLRCGSTTCSVNAAATAASKALPPFSSIAMPTAVAIQWVVVTTPNVPSISGRVVKVFGLTLVMNVLLLPSDMEAFPAGCAASGARIETVGGQCIWPRAWLPVWGSGGESTSQDRNGRARRRRAWRGAPPRSRHSRSRARGGRGARPGQGAAQSAGDRRAHPDRRRRGAGAILRRGGRMFAAATVSRRRLVGDRGRQDFHAAVRRPAPGKLGSGGARQGNRRPHSGADRRAPRASTRCAPPPKAPSIRSP